jgi:hypothetical protein
MPALKVEDVMSASTGKKRMSQKEAALLCRLLAQEERQYRHLLELARQQNGCLRRHDVESLEKNAAQWQKVLPGARQARRRREECVAEMARRLGAACSELEPKYLVDYVDQKVRGAIAEVIQRLVTTAGDLYRQNELNRQLAGFCFHLAREEAEIFKRCVLEDPAGCYSEDARKSVGSGRGFFVRQA